MAEPKPILADARFQDLTGRPFGKLTVEAFVGKQQNKARLPLWLCRCECGETRIVTTIILTRTYKPVDSCRKCARLHLRKAGSCVMCGKPTKRMSDTSRKLRKTCSPECQQMRRAECIKARPVHRDRKDIGLDHRRRAKLVVLHHYSNGDMKCDCCGEKHLEFLTIDHINGGGVQHRKELGNGKLASGGGKFYTWLRRSGYPEGYRVLCLNCNFSKGVFGYCPHERQEVSPLAIFAAAYYEKLFAKKMAESVEVPCEGDREHADAVSRMLDEGCPNDGGES